MFVCLIVFWFILVYVRTHMHARACVCVCVCVCVFYCFWFYFVLLGYFDCFFVVVVFCLLTCLSVWFVVLVCLYLFVCLLLHVLCWNSCCLLLLCIDLSVYKISDRIFYACHLLSLSLRVLRFNAMSITFASICLLVLKLSLMIHL